MWSVGGRRLLVRWCFGVVLVVWLGYGPAMASQVGAPAVCRLALVHIATCYQPGGFQTEQSISLPADSRVEGLIEQVLILTTEWLRSFSDIIESSLRFLGRCCSRPEELIHYALCGVLDSNLFAL